MDKKIVAVFNLTYSVALGIIGIDNQEDTVQFCWINDGKQEPARKSKIRYGSRDRAYFIAGRQCYYLDEFVKC